MASKSIQAFELSILFIQDRKILQSAFRIVKRLENRYLVID